MKNLTLREVERDARQPIEKIVEVIKEVIYGRESFI